MVHEFKLPDVGEGLAEAEIVAWHVEVGDPVEEDQIVGEVETDKAIVEVPSPVDGTVAEILAEPGEMVAVGDVIITFEVSDTDRPAQAEASADEAVETAIGDATTETPTEPDRVFAAPSARRLARELGVAIDRVQGSGPGGRVTDADVQAAAERDTGEGGSGIDGVPADGPHAGPGADGEPQPAVRRIDRADSESELTDTEHGIGAGVTRDRTLATPATRRIARELDVDIDRVPASDQRDGAAVVTEEDVRTFARTADRSAAAAGDEQPDLAAAGAAPTRSEAPTRRVERVPYRGIRRTIGEQMERSAYTAPHVTHHDDVDVTALVELRERLKDPAEARGSTLTYLPFVVKAVVAGLEAHPWVNSELDEGEDEILLKHYYNIGIATATDAGLMVPVVEDAGEKTLLELADEIQELTERARNRSIDREAMQGGTFTITNFGAIGGEYATPIINHPETAILGLGAITERPRVVDGSVVPKTTLPLSLSIDHRVIDGAVGARFVNTVKDYLRDPELLLLE